MPGTPTSGPLDRGSSTQRRLWQAVVALSILVIAVVLFAWSQGDEAGGEASLNAIAAAAERTQDQPGGRATMRTIVSSPQLPASVTVTGRMVYDAESGRSEAVMTVPVPSSGSSVEMDAITDGTVMYLRSSLFSSLPDGSEWLAFDLALGEELEVPVPANADAMGELGLLESATGPVEKLGRESVRGVPTTHYRGTISAAENAEQLREAGADSLASLIEEAGSQVQVEVWIDAQGLVRRMRMVESRPLPGGAGITTTDSRLEFFDFGPVPEIDVPDPGEVFDATELAKERIGLPG